MQRDGPVSLLPWFQFRRAAAVRENTDRGHGAFHLKSIGRNPVDSMGATLTYNDSRQENAMLRHPLAVSLLSLFAAISALPAHAVQRVFVASYGNDANTATNCGFTNPCRGFTASMTVV